MRERERGEFGREIRLELCGPKVRKYDVQVENGPHGENQSLKNKKINKEIQC